MNFFQAIILGIVQALTEYLPVSSSAHIRIIGDLMLGADPGAAFTANQVHDAATPSEAIGLARGLATQAGEDAVVLVIGSVYLAGQARELLLGGL